MEAHRIYKVLQDAAGRYADHLEMLDDVAEQGGGIRVHTIQVTEIREALRAVEPKPLEPLKPTGTPKQTRSPYQRQPYTVSDDKNFDLDEVEKELDDAIADKDVTMRNKKGVHVHNKLERLKADSNGHPESWTDEQQARLLSLVKLLLREVFNIDPTPPK